MYLDSISGVVSLNNSVLLSRGERAAYLLVVIWSFVVKLL